MKLNPANNLMRIKAADGILTKSWRNQKRHFARAATFEKRAEMCGNDRRRSLNSENNK